MTKTIIKMAYQMFHQIHPDGLLTNAALLMISGWLSASSQGNGGEGVYDMIDRTWPRFNRAYMAPGERGLSREEKLYLDRLSWDDAAKVPGRFSMHESIINDMMM